MVKRRRQLDTIAIVASLRRRQAMRAVRRVVQWLEQRGLEVRLQQAVATRLRRRDLGRADDQLMRGASLALSLGGDGTMLASARLAAPGGIPILGCNLGGFGFLTELGESELTAALPAVLRGEFEVRDRMMVEGDVLRAAPARPGIARLSTGAERLEVVRTFLGLNDVVITKGAFSRMLRLEIAVAGQQLGVFSADGVMVATPTGSTAYSLSAGGPVVTPQVEALMLTPICAHTLSARPLVVHSSDEIRVSASAEGLSPRGLSPAHAAAAPARPGIARLSTGAERLEVVVTVDGQEGFALAAGDVVRVRKARVAAHIVHLEGPSFFVKVRTKLGWAGRS